MAIMGKPSQICPSCAMSETCFNAHKIDFNLSECSSWKPKRLTQNKTPRCPSCKSTKPLTLFEGILSCKDCYDYFTPSFNKGYWVGYYDGKKENER